MKNHKYVILFIISLYFGNFNSIILGQKSKLDSLFNVLKSTKSDTSLVKIYNNIGWEYQSTNADSALYYVKLGLELSIKINYKNGTSVSYNILGAIYKLKGEYDKAIAFYFKSLKKDEETMNKQGMATCYINIGIVFYNKCNYDKALSFYFKSLKIWEEIGDKNGMSATYNNIGATYLHKGDYYKAIDFYFKSLKKYEEQNNKQGVANSYTNIGAIHMYKGDYDKAFELFFKSLIIFEELGDKKGISNYYNNIGAIHTNKGDYDKAIEFHLKSLKIREELDDKKGMSASYSNIGITYENKKEYYKAIEFYFKNLKISEELADKHGMSRSYNGIGGIYLKLSKPNEAKKQQLLALNFAIEIGAKADVYYIYNSLAQCDSALGNFRGAYEYQKLYSQVHDSVFSAESDEKITEMNVRYDTEKKQLQIEKLGKEKELQLSENKKQRILIFSFLAGFIIILVFSFFLYRLFVQKKKANIIIALKNQSLEIAFIEISQQKEEITSQRDEIEAQRNLVTKQKESIEEIHKSVTDSINYAKRIQQAILPDISYKSKKLYSKFQASNLKPQAHIEFEAFVLFCPKDIVSGDFYWFSKVNDYLIYAVADCTGHGVPGAFMSMLGVSFLNEIVRKKEVVKASDVLDHLRESIIEALQQKGQTGEQKDGMDISLCAINTTTMKCQWAGANNPLWIVTQSSGLLLDEVSQVKTPDRGSVGLGEDASANIEPQTSNIKLFEFKPDKQPIAIHIEMKPFTNHEMQLSKGDTIYLASDGYEDQFGGPKGKKFLSKNLKQLLADNCEKPMSEQKDLLDKTIEDWKNGFGTAYEQIDDITVVGIRI